VASSDIDAVRLLVGDPAGDNQALADADIAFFLQENGDNCYTAAADAADALAARYTARVDVRVGILSSSDSQLARNYSTLAGMLRTKAASRSVAAGVPFAGGVRLADKDGWDGVSLVRPAFARGAATGESNEEVSRC